jgi:hypothetical protein
MADLVRGRGADIQPWLAEAGLCEAQLDEAVVTLGFSGVPPFSAGVR